MTGASFNSVIQPGHDEIVLMGFKWSSCQVIHERSVGSILSTVMHRDVKESRRVIARRYLHPKPDASISNADKTDRGNGHRQRKCAIPRVSDRCVAMRCQSG